MMLSAGVKPIIIFDGCRLEMKSNTEAERRRYKIIKSINPRFRNRKEAREKAEEYMR